MEVVGFHSENLEWEFFIQLTVWWLDPLLTRVVMNTFLAERRENVEVQDKAKTGRKCRLSQNSLSLHEYHVPRVDSCHEYYLRDYIPEMSQSEGLLKLA